MARSTSRARQYSSTERHKTYRRDAEAAFVFDHCTVTHIGTVVNEFSKNKWEKMGKKVAGNIGKWSENALAEMRMLESVPRSASACRIFP